MPLPSSTLLPSATLLPGTPSSGLRVWTYNATADWTYTPVTGTPGTTLPSTSLLPSTSTLPS